MTATTAVGIAAVDQHRVRYAGFGYRLTAGLVDLVVLAPVIAASIWLMSIGPAVALVGSLAQELVYFSYTIIGHARWGQTLGKRAAGIRVLDVSGRPIRWRQAFRRSSVDIALSMIANVTYWGVMWRAYGDLAGQPWSDVQDRFYEMRPAWVAAIDYVYFAWIGSEIVSVLFNKRRRALHDFVGGTIVVVEPHRVRQPLPPLPGWRGVLSRVDAAVTAVGIGLGVLFLLVVGAATAESDSTSVRELGGAAAHVLTIAGVAWAGRRLLRAGGRWHWGPHLLALFLVLMAISAVLR